MKSIRWIGWVALVALCVMPLAAAPAWAAPNFSGAPLAGVVPLTVTFTPTGVTGVPDSITWSFGDGGWANGAGVKVHAYTTGPADYTVVMSVWYTASADTIISKGSYVSTVQPSIVAYDTNKAPCGGVLNINLPDTVLFEFFSRPADSVWWIIKDNPTGGTFIDSIRTTGASKFLLTYVFTLPDTFLVTGKPFAGDSLITADTAAYVYITSDCFCVQAVLDGYSMNENDTLRAFVLDNDTLGNHNQPRPVDSVVVMTWNSDPNVLDTVYFDTTTTGLWRMVYIPQANWHGKDSITYGVYVHDGCTPGVATVAITVYSNFRVDIDSLWYVLKDMCTNSCDVDPNTISLHDSLQLWVKINPVDVQELAPGWPKAFFAGLGGSAGGDVMFQDTTDGDSIYFSIPFQDTAGADPDWREILGGGIDVAPGFYAISAQIMSDSAKLSAETTIVTQRIDTKGPLLPPDAVTFTMDYDSLANGIVGVGDWLKFYIDLRNNPIVYNPPWAKEICQVTVKLDSMWAASGSAPVWITLVDSANDNRFKGYYKVGPGRLDTLANSMNAWFFVSDNACNIDSVMATLAPPVDNKAPMLTDATIIYERILDRDSTNCLGVGASDPLADSVLIRVTNVSLDVDFLWADLLRAGIGGTNLPLAARYPLVNKGAGVWELRWLLKTNLLDKVKHPIDGDSISPTIDWPDSIPPANAIVKIISADLSGNGDFKLSGPLLGPLGDTLSIDTRVPKPVTGLGCVRDTTPAGTPTFTLSWLTQDYDAEKFLIFWNDGCGEVNYDETLAVAFLPQIRQEPGPGSDKVGADPIFTWTADSTVKPISPCRTYKFNVWTVDNCNNVERVHPTATSCGTTVATVVLLDATSPEPGTVRLTWTGADSNAAKYYIYWDAGTGTINYSTKLDSVLGGPGAQSWDSVNCSLFRPGFAGDSTYKFAVRTVDSCTVNTPSCPTPTDVGATDTAMVRHIKPVTLLTCTSIENGAIQLKWKQLEPAVWVGKMYIHYGKDSANAIDWTTNVDTITYQQAGIYSAITGYYTWNTTMANPALALVEKGLYVFTVESEDDCGYLEVEHPTPTYCWSDKAPAYACVIQPEPGSLYCDNSRHGLTIYTCAKDSASNDITSVTAWGRVKDTSPAAGDQPGDWFVLGGASQAGGGVCFHIVLSPIELNYQVGADTVQRIEVAIGTTDIAGKIVEADEAWENCETEYWFDWSTRVIDGSLVTINGQQRVLQVACGVRGYQIYGPINPVVISVTGGTPPYALQVWVDSMSYLYQERVDNSITFNLNALGFDKGAHLLQVFWSDSCGWTGSAMDSLCVPDSVPPCAIVSNPVDGKCIRRSRSMLDPIGTFEQPITITITGNDLTPNGQSCIDQTGVLKVDFQWSKECCIGSSVDSTWISTWYNCDDTLSNGDNLVCDTIFNFYGTGRHSITCRDTTITPTCSTKVWVLSVDTIPCEDIYEWHTFAIDSANGGSVYTANWYNHDDLSWITESGTNIYLRGIVYDNNGNIFITPCAQVCIDIDTPPLCIRTENLCPDGRLRGAAKILAELNWGEGNTDDIEDVFLWTKKSHDPDLYGYWTSHNAGIPATNSTMWTWDVDLSKFADQTYYDFRVIAKTTWGTWSYDLDGNGQFDALTFDTTNCDAKTWLIDNTAPNIAIDTAWTTINGQELVIPNTGCRMSDPKGYIWTQYGNSITVQPTVYPLTDMGDVVKTQWTLYDGSGLTGADCACHADTSDFDAGDGALSYVFAVKEGSHAMDDLVFDPTLAPFVHVTQGYQTHVLHVKAWDGCGNTSEDCIEVFLLDIDTTEAIIISPVNDSVFCDQTSADGGIALTAATLIDNDMAKAVFSYRAKGTLPWIVIDSVQVSPTHGTVSVVWYPRALGLSEGDYEVTVWVTDQALNHQGPDGYPVTIHFSCAVPTVAVTYPTTGDPAFIGCPIELEASAASSDPRNPIVEVRFYIQSILSDSALYIGSDEFTVDGLWSVSWDPHSTYWKGKLSDGHYYLWAEAQNRAGLVTKSVLKAVEVKYDETAPHSEIIQVNGDRSDGGATDPTVVHPSETVPLYVLSADDNSPAGYGLTDNSGLDSVMIYVTEDASIGGKVVFGTLMTPVDSLSGLYVVDWPTNGLDRGLYHVTAVAIDKACNRASCACDWLVKIEDVPTATIGVTEAVEYCGYMNVKDGPIHVTLTPGADEAVGGVEIWRSNASSSDVYDQWSLVGFTNEAVDGIFTIEVDADSLALWAEGLYRLRAFYYSTDGSYVDDGNANGKLDDFTFNPASKPWQMWLNVDRSVTPYLVSLDKSTIKAGTSVKVTVDPDQECDISQICYDVEAQNGNIGYDSCMSSLTYTFDPIDSGLVSLNHGIWSGPVQVSVTDPLGNENTVQTSDLYILDMNADQAMVVDPAWGDYLTGSKVILTARKLTSGTITSVDFYYDATPTGAGTKIGTDNSATGDVFSFEWDLSAVTEGDKYVWAKTTGGETRRVFVIVAKTPTNIVIDTSRTDYHARIVGNDTLLFVGGRVDLCLDRASISNIETVGIDSVVFGYRRGDAPGNSIPAYPDTEHGWVRINADRYGSLCVDWFACDTIAETCEDGRYAVAAWVYDKAGNVNHSEKLVHFMIDCTEPYSEVVDIEGDETFGTCHETIGGAKVPITAVVVDDRSCAGSEPQWNSGAKLLQFFAGQCGEGATAGGAADIVFVIDYSGSMSGEISKVQAEVTSFASSLSSSGVDFALGLVEACSPMTVAQSLTTNVSTFNSAVNSAGCSGSVQSYDAMTGLANGTINVGFRPGAKKFIILITDTSPETGTASSIEFCSTPNPTEEATVASTVSGASVTLFAIVETPTDPSYSGSCAAEDQNAYDQIVTATSGSFYDLDASSYAVLFSQISADIVRTLGSTETPLSIVFQETVPSPEPSETVYWNTTGLLPGKYCVWTRAEDSVGNVYVSSPVEVCIVDKTAPVAWIAGFGMSTDEHLIHDQYKIYARSWATDIHGMMFQSKKSGDADWVTIGIASKIDGDSSFWMTSWNPCGLSGNYSLRAVPTDKVSNSDPSKQPILAILLDGACGLTLPEEPSALSVGFEDRAFANLGIVDVKGAPSDSKLTEMTAVYADEIGGLATEKVTLHRGLTTKSFYEGSFDDALILNGGTGWFWAVYNDFAALKTYLKKGDLRVWQVTDVGFPDTLKFSSPATTVLFQDEAVTTDNGVVIYPAHDPTVWLDQQHLRAWPSIDGTDMVTAIRLTSPLDYGFSTGRYAKITISYYAPGVASGDLSVAWWDGDHWETNEGLRIGGVIENGKATFWTDNLYGIYAVVSKGGVYFPGAVEVQIVKPVEESTNPWPTLRTLVRSKLNTEYENYDIDEDKIIVTLDDVVIFTDYESASGWDGSWDEISGILKLVPDQPICGDTYYPDGGSAKPAALPGLATGSHWIKVQAFNRQGQWNFDSTGFTVDAAEPKVTAESQRTVCPNATFHFSVSDVGVGVNWDSVFIDVHDFTASEPTDYPLSRLIETVSPDDVVRDGNGNVTFTVNASLAQMRRVKIVIYDGVRFDDWDECGCVWYDHVCDGVPDLVGNHTEIVEVTYTVDGSACFDTTGGTGITPSSTDGSNPFDPWSAGHVTFNLNGFGAGGGTVTATVYDLTGERVKTLTVGQSGAMWDGRNDENDKIVAEGVYLIHFQRIGGTALGATSQVVKVVVKRK